MRNHQKSIDLLIIGGGIHGMHLFHLIKQKRSDLTIRIADPHPVPLHNWKHCTSNTGMNFLRSPEVHHLDIDALSLNRFAKRTGNLSKPFTTPNNRPALSLFNHHSERIFSEYDIANHWLQTEITDIDLSEHGAVVSTIDGEISANHVILAIGNGGQLKNPDWAAGLNAHSFPLQHIYSPEFDVENYKPGFHTVLIGSGMGAVQTFNKLAKTHSGKITLISPSEIKVAQYDVEPGWMGPKYLTYFREQKSYETRRQLINSARQRGTITSDINHELQQVLKYDYAAMVVGRVTSAELFGADNAYLKLENGQTVFCDRILLGTGFDPVINTGLIQKLKNNHALRCSKCGYPIVDPLLRWHPNLSVTGELAELELGPAAKNIIGARHAGQRIRHLFNTEI